MTTKLTREDVINLVKTARNQGQRPDLRGQDLSGLDLSGLDLSHVDLYGADLRWMDLSYADLSYADLSCADLAYGNLRYVNLRGACLSYGNLRYVNLRGANLRGADLGSADLTGARLSYADLAYADLRGANLRGADLRGHMPIKAPSGPGHLMPTPDGWQISIGCWKHHALEELDDLIHDRAEWPAAEGEEREKRRPILAAIHALAVAHATYYADVVQALDKKWNVK